MDTEEIIVDDRPIGHGGNGAVYKLIGYQPPAVIKYLINVNDDLIREFKKEYEVLDRLSHPNMINYIKSVENFNDPLKRFAIITEYCERGNLVNFLANPNTLYTIKTVIFWSRGLFDAVGSLFEKYGLLHKDVKPGNIFITKDWKVKLGDFGSARACDGTSIGAFRGTIRYSVPHNLGMPKMSEKAEKEEEELHKRCYHRNDVYSLGLVLWELVERRRVYSKYEKYDANNGRDFNNDLFYSFLHANQCFDLEPMNCIDDLRVIFENTTKFLAIERPDAMQIRDELTKLESNSFINEFIEVPRIDEEETHLIRPRGFDGTKNRVLVAYMTRNVIDEDDLTVPDAENFFSNSPSVGFVLSKEDSKQPEPLLDNFLPKKFSNLDRFKIQELFAQLSLVEKQEFYQESRSLYDEVMEKRRYFDELGSEGIPSPYSSHSDENLAPSQAIRSLFQKILEFKIICFQGLAVGDFFSTLGKVDRGFFDPHGHYRHFCEMIDKLEEYKRDLFPSARFLFKCYISTINQKEWLFVREYPEINRNSFVSKNLSEIQPFYGIWSDDRKTLTLKKGHEDEQLIRNISATENLGLLLYSHDEPIDFFKIIDAMREKSRQIQRIDKLKLQKFLPLEQVDCPKFELPSKIGRHLPIPGCCFQLRNPPRASCDREIKCAVIDLEFVSFYECSPKKAKAYLKAYLRMCKDFEQMENFNHNFYTWAAQNPMITKRTISYKFSRVKRLKGQYFVFLQCPNFLNHQKGKNVILLDHPNNYQKGERIPFFDYDLLFYEVEASFLATHLEKHSKSLSYILMAPIEDHIIKYKIVDGHGKGFIDEYLEQVDIRVAEMAKRRKKREHHRSKAEKATFLFY